MPSHMAEGTERASRAVSIAWVAGAVALGVVLGFLALLPPSPTEADADPAGFSAERAFEHVVAVATEPHPVGSASNAEVRNYIVATLEALGLESELQTIEVPDYFGDPSRTVPVVNVVARIDGEEAFGAVALVAHYDTVPTTTGANDNSAGVAALLETARALLAGPPLSNDVILLFTDGEEPAPRFGSSAFVGEHRWASDIGLVVNLESAGGSGPSMLIDVAGPQAWLIDSFAQAVPYPVAFSFVTELVDLIGGSNTDFAPFRDSGVSGFEFAYLHESPIYHTAGDTVNNVNLGSLQHHGSHTLSLTRHFGETDLTQQPPTGESVYFTIIGNVVVRYPTEWAALSAIVVALLVGIAATRRIRRNGQSLSSVFVGVGVVLLAIVAATVAASAVWRLLVAVRQQPGLLESYSYLFGLIALAVGLFLVILKLFEYRVRHIDVAAGTVIVWAGLGLATGLWLPGASYLFIWPALIGVLALSLDRHRQDPARTSTVWVGVLIALAVPTLILFTPAVDFFFQMAQSRPGNPDSQVTELVAVSIFLSVLVAALVSAGAYPQRTWTTQRASDWHANDPPPEPEQIDSA